MTKEIEIRSADQVYKINALAEKAPYEVWLATDTVMLDARSLMGLFALVGQRAKVVAEDDVSPRSFSRMVDKMEASGHPARAGGKHARHAQEPDALLEAMDDDKTPLIWE